MNKSKVLHIVRHAKSSWDYQNISDYDRPLKLRGIMNAYEMARRLKIRNTIPELIITSPANRALHTATIFARVIELPFGQLCIDADFYGAELENILNRLKALDDKIHSVMIFGHNPEFTSLANFLAKKPVGDVPTAGIVSITFNTEKWKELGKDNVAQLIFDYPKKEMQV